MTELPAALQAVRRWLGSLRPEVAVVLGSGLGGMANSIESPRRLGYADIPGFPLPTIVGHGGELIAGVLEGRPVLLQSGRFHMYEGHDPEVTSVPVRIFGALGIGTIVLTNAAGGVRPGLKPPVLMLIADHINLTWRNPIIGPVVGSEQRFPDMSQPFDRELRQLAREAARAECIELEEGIYAGLLGPSYETPAEIRMLQRIGVDAVGMSTVPEVIAARAGGLRVMGVSSITNLAAGISSTRLSHTEVLAAGRQVAGDLERLVRGVIRRLHR
jgi:purine-nucleoside phosphorylase